MKYIPSKKNKQKGITLIALVITIVVLLIITGVAVTEIKDGGIIPKAKKSAERYSETSELERVKLATYDAFVKENGEITTESLKEGLTKYFKDDYEILKAPTTEDIPLTGKIVKSIQLADLNGVNYTGERKFAMTATTNYWKIKITSSGNIYIIKKDGEVSLFTSTLDEMENIKTDNENLEELV